MSVLRSFSLYAAMFLGLGAAAGQARAQAPGGAEDLAPSLPGPEESAPADPVEDLQQQIDELRQQLRTKEEEQLRNAPRLFINGYLDFGFFAPLGNDGVGWYRDFGNQQFPQYADGISPDYAWTFLGDILSTPVNTRGEPADLGDAPGVSRFDGINANGAGGFLVNEVNLRLGYRLADRVLLRTSVNFVPRSARQAFSLGDFMDVDIAEMEYIVTDDGNTSIFVGKTLPVFGIEYKEFKSDERFGITPSLMHRYTSGPQLGVKARSKLFDEWVILAAAISNNSSTTEPFHFKSEIDQNWGKTFSGRAALSVPLGQMAEVLGADRLELGLSGIWGPQDWATNNRGKMRFWGVDLQYLGTNFTFKGQFMRGKAPGRAAEGVWMLDLDNSGYLEATWMFLPNLGVLGRAALRDAIVALAADRIYITKTMQFTGGVRVVFNEHIALKAEYLHNLEYDGVEAFDNDIATSSLVLSF